MLIGATSTRTVGVQADEASALMAATPLKNILGHNLIAPPLIHRFLSRVADAVEIGIKKLVQIQGCVQSEVDRRSLRQRQRLVEAASAYEIHDADAGFRRCL